MFADNCSEVGLPDPMTMPGGLRVRSERVEVESGRALRALVWGSGDPELVFVHGGAQNAHTWDTTVLALGLRHGITNAVCIDLPGHGQSDWRADHHYVPTAMADDVAVVVRALAPNAAMVIGMSLGGMTSLALADQHPDIVRKLCMVDVTPGVNAGKAKAITDFIRGPQFFPSFSELLARTIEHNPTRSVTSLRRGILHNAHRNPDGSWSWNYDRGLSEAMPQKDAEPAATDGMIERFNPLWEVYDRLTMPLLVLRGALSPVVDDADIAEVRRRSPSAHIRVVEAAGHSIQGDQPVVLAGLLAEFLGSTP